MALKVHHLRPAPGAHTPKTRKGRGEGSKGKTAGRGTKGTKARGTVPASFEGGQMPLQCIPKLKGFKNPNKVDFQVVNVATINKLFPEGRRDGERSSGQGAVRSGQPVKVLGRGDLRGVRSLRTSSPRALVTKSTLPGARRSSCR